MPRLLLLVKAGQARLIAAVVNFLGNSFERSAILLLVHEAARFGVALGPVPVLRVLNLSSTVHRATSEPVSSILCHGIHVDARAC